MQRKYILGKIRTQALQVLKWNKEQACVYLQQGLITFLTLCHFYSFPSLTLWKWCDIRPSMVTHTRNSCSAFTHPKCTHTAVNTHTPWTHTRSSGQPFMLRHPGSSWGFGALLKGTSVMVLKEERALYIHSPHLQFLPDLRLKPTTFGLRVWLSNH